MQLYLEDNKTTTTMATKFIGNGSVGAYSFNAATKKVTITGVTLSVFQILNINNVTRNQMIYNPFQSGLGYTSFVGGVLTLVYDTTSYSNGDVLLIAYNDDDKVLNSIVDLSNDIRNLFAQMASPIWAEGGYVKIASSSIIATVTTVGTVTSVTTVSTVTTVTTVTTVSSLTNIVNIGSVPASDRLMGIEFSLLRDRITF